MKKKITKPTHRTKRGFIRNTTQNSVIIRILDRNFYYDVQVPRNMFTEEPYPGLPLSITVSSSKNIKMTPFRNRPDQKFISDIKEAVGGKA